MSEVVILMKWTDYLTSTWHITPSACPFFCDKMPWRCTLYVLKSVDFAFHYDAKAHGWEIAGMLANLTCTKKKMHGLVTNTGRSYYSFALLYHSHDLDTTLLRSWGNLAANQRWHTVPEGWHSGPPNNQSDIKLWGLLTFIRTYRFLVKHDFIYWFWRLSYVFFSLWFPDSCFAPNPSLRAVFPITHHEQVISVLSPYKYFWEGGLGDIPQKTQNLPFTQIFILKYSEIKITWLKIKIFWLWVW